MATITDYQKTLSKIQSDRARAEGQLQETEKQLAAARAQLQVHDVDSEDGLDQVIRRLDAEIAAETKTLDAIVAPYVDGGGTTVSPGEVVAVDEDEFDV